MDFKHNLTIDEIRRGQILEYDELFKEIEATHPKGSAKHKELLKKEKILFKASALFVDKHKGYYTRLRNHYISIGNINKNNNKSVDKTERTYFGNGNINQWEI